MPSSRNSLPFEPKKNKKKVKNQAPNTTNSVSDNSPPKSAELKQGRKKQDASLRAIPDAVSKRMVRRMAVFSGIPTFMGIASFIIFYLIVSQEWFDIPNTAVLLVSMGLFGLGVLGLSYGLLSTSWDEDRVGSLWGGEEFAVNFGRLTSAWRNSRQKSNSVD